MSEQAFTYNTDSPYLTVTFLDVGQGDAIYIETPDGVQALIDGGANNAVLRELGKQMPLFDRSLDVVLATHPDKDHIGGLVDVLKRYEVANIIRTNNEGETATIDAFNLAVSNEGTAISYATAGQQLALGASTSVLILSPAGDVTDLESNTSSIVAQLRYGEVEFMLTGDAPVSIEKYLVDTFGEALESEVLKFGHHGSRTSTADEFLDTVDPQYGVVSAGQDNRYGHPHKEVIEKAESRGVDIFNTADIGTIVFKTDGKDVWVEE
ncbi:MAG: MBL fold metallo-hydrolase [Candidatus Nomurabacteria bacterium]|nr:MBL fold metallo-hydrolase [Candidatus Nomurabacteria bacterium]USN87353.1 MAG: MBL fold metallo-hydrolase [Candidatus Nomurabacteria bacterium]